MDRDKIIKIIKMAIDIEKHNAKMEERSIDLENVEKIVDELINQIEEKVNLFNWRENTWREAER